MRLSHYHGLILILLLGFLSLSVGVSQGHVSFDHSDPRVGSTISDSPSAVRIWFDSDIEPASSRIVVQNMDGKTVNKGDSRVDPEDPTLLEVSVPPLPPGIYHVRWEVVSRDGHHTMGRFTFTVKEGK